MVLPRVSERMRVEVQLDIDLAGGVAAKVFALGGDQEVGL